MRTLRDLPAAAIVGSIADAAERWTDADYPARVRATRAVMERTGYSEPVVDFALDRLFQDLTRAHLMQTIAGELGSIDALDGFVPRPDRSEVFFRGLDAVTIVSSDTTIGVAIAPLAFALAAKCAVVVKDRDDSLVAAFGETLAEERPDFSASLAVERWKAHDDPHALARFAQSDIVVAFGNDRALRAIRETLPPQARFMTFGHRTSAGYVSREALANEASARALAAAAARDALLYDGEGCLSVHALFVESGASVSPEAFARLLSAALAEAAREFPSSREAGPAALAYERRARFAAAQGDGTVYGMPEGHLVTIDPHGGPPPLLPRTLALYPIAEPAEALAVLRRHDLPLEAFALPGDARADLVTLAVRSGAARIAPPGTLQAPTIRSEHGGVPRILPFVRAIVRER
ncbi:MAG: hypothetical protein GIW95_03165 [Candidatus Eremiobacteraeota bacterium]|nr:hypothetical protein [Candidatus Eremiobacteraeota bacterium]